MAKITFSKLNLKLNKDEEKIKIGENEITVRKYLPQVEKAELISFVIERSLDEKTGCFSPIRLETYFALAVVKWYTDITFTDKQIDEAAKTYDVLESNGIFKQIYAAIPQDEFDYIDNAVAETAEDIANYNHSLAGILAFASDSTNNLSEQIDKVLAQVKNKEGIELLSEIKNVVG